MRRIQNRVSSKSAQILLCATAGSSTTTTELFGSRRWCSTGGVPKNSQVQESSIFDRFTPDEIKAEINAKQAALEELLAKQTGEAGDIPAAVAAKEAKDEVIREEQAAAEAATSQEDMYGRSVEKDNAEGVAAAESDHRGSRVVEDSNTSHSETVAAAAEENPDAADLGAPILDNDGNIIPQIDQNGNLAKLHPGGKMLKVSSTAGKKPLWEDCDTIEDIMDEEKYGSPGELPPVSDADHVLLAYRALAYGTLIAIAMTAAFMGALAVMFGFKSWQDVKDHLDGNEERRMKALQEMAAEAGEDDLNPAEMKIKHFELDITSPSTLPQQVEDLVALIHELAEEQEKEELASQKQ